MSSLRSKERLFQKDDTGNWRAPDVPAFCLDVDFREAVLDRVRDDFVRLLRLPVLLDGEDRRLVLELDDLRAEALEVFF
jgi:hypothetical protein